MVWSKHKGLGLQDLASRLGEKKASQLWNTESFNIVISSPKHADHGESSHSKDLAEVGLNLLQLKPNCEEKNGASRKNESVIRNDEQESRNYGDLNVSNKREVNLGKGIPRNNQLADKEVENTSQSVDTIQVKDLFSGPNKLDQTAECLSYNLKERNGKSSGNFIKESDQMEVCETSSRAIQPANQGFTHGNPLMASSGSKLMNTAERKCFKMIDFDINIPVIQETTEEDEVESFRAHHKGKSTLIESSKSKGKAQVTSFADESESSKDSGHSHDSAESSSSKWLISTSKRARSYKLETSVENKRLKKQSYEGCSSGSGGSSFMNWVSTITNGFSGFAEARPLSFAPPPFSYIEGNPKNLSLSQGKEIGVTYKDMGFKSLFRSLVPPGYNMKSSTNMHQITEPMAAKDLNVECKKLEFNLHRILPTDDRRLNIVNRNDSHNEVSLQADRLKKNLQQGEEFGAANGNVSLGSSALSTNNKNKLLQNLWITRFSPKVSSGMQISVNEEGMDTRT
ncbi:uncharacterized protein LOC109848976 isoform X1 [Asparagus officinalis]|nr:uncharacterized protein LOC109848976 isoform X1 [Asparagus officinalis]